jgi:hypothetical protein
VKGEVLLVDIPNFPTNIIYKNKYSIVPWQNSLYWVGSSFERNFTNELPTHLFKQEVTNWLKDFLNLPFTVVDHFAATRPTTMNREPIFFLHDIIGTLNGMGTKGCLQAPQAAKQLTQKIIQQFNQH